MRLWANLCITSEYKKSGVTTNLNSERKRCLRLFFMHCWQHVTGLKMEHIPSRYFSHSLSFEERWEIPKIYSGSDWDYVRQFLSETQQVTKSAIKVSEVIKKHFDIELFPTIFKVACKGWDAGGGTAYFSMQGKNGKSYLFWTPAKTFQAINGVYSQDEDGFCRER